MTSPSLVWTVKMLLLIASMHATSCVAVDENAIEKRLESSIGQKFSESRWSKPTAAKRVVREEDDEIRVYEFSWANGCSYRIVVRKIDDVIASWRFTSDTELCRRIIRSPLGS